MTSTPLVGQTFFGLDISGISKFLAAISRRISRSTLLIEFGPQMIQLAEAVPQLNGLRLRHITRIALPEGALDRSIPSDPAAMARLIQEICEEKRIQTHRVSVVLPPELAFQRVISLHRDLDADDARELLLNPASGVQIPFPIARTDFEVTPLQAPSTTRGDHEQRPFLLTAMPSTMVDQLMTMLELADLELQTLELGGLSSLRCIHRELDALSESCGCLVLEFLTEATLGVLVDFSGPIATERLASIREFPRFELSSEQLKQVLSSSQSLDDLSMKNERYLPISEMDLRALYVDLDSMMAEFKERFPDVHIRNVWLMGEGSAFPELSHLIEQQLSLPVRRCSPFLSDHLSDWSFDDAVLHSSLNRLVGLGLGLVAYESGAQNAAETISPEPHVEPELLAADLEPIPSSSSVPDSEEPFNASLGSNGDLYPPLDVEIEQPIAEDHSVYALSQRLGSVDDEHDFSGQDQLINLSPSPDEKQPSEIESLHVDQLVDRCQHDDEARETSPQDLAMDDVNRWPSLSIQDKSNVVGSMGEAQSTSHTETIEPEARVVPTSQRQDDASEPWPTISLEQKTAEPVGQDIDQVSVQISDEAKSGLLPSGQGSVEETTQWPSITRADQAANAVSEVMPEDHPSDDAEDIPKAGLDLSVNQAIDKHDNDLALSLDQTTAVYENHDTNYDSDHIAELAKPGLLTSAQGLQEETSQWPSIKLNDQAADAIAEVIESDYSRDDVEEQPTSELDLSTNLAKAEYDNDLTLSLEDKKLTNESKDEDQESEARDTGLILRFQSQQDESESWPTLSSDRSINDTDAAAKQAEQNDATDDEHGSVDHQVPSDPSGSNNTSPLSDKDRKDPIKNLSSSDSDQSPLGDLRFQKDD